MMRARAAWTEGDRDAMLEYFATGCFFHEEEFGRAYVPLTRTGSVVFTDGRDTGTTIVTTSADSDLSVEISSWLEPGWASADAGTIMRGNAGQD